MTTKTVLITLGIVLLLAMVAAGAFWAGERYPGLLPGTTLINLASPQSPGGSASPTSLIRGTIVAINAQELQLHLDDGTTLKVPLSSQTLADSSNGRPLKIGDTILAPVPPGSSKEVIGTIISANQTSLAITGAGSTSLTLAITPATVVARETPKDPGVYEQEVATYQQNQNVGAAPDPNVYLPAQVTDLVAGTRVSVLYPADNMAPKAVVITIQP